MQDLFWSLISIIGDDKFYVALTVLVYLVYSKKLGFRISIVLLTSMWTNLTLKYYFNVPRPLTVDFEFQHLTPSFPSGHAQVTSTFWFFIALNFRSFKAPMLALASLLTVLVSYSRIYLGFHYLADVVVGSILGLAFACSSRVLLKTLEDRVGECKLPIGSSFLSVILTLTTLTSRLGVEGGTLLISGLMLGISIAYYLYCRRGRFVSLSPLLRVLQGAFGILVSGAAYLGYYLRGYTLPLDYPVYAVSGLTVFYVIPRIFDFIILRSR